MKIGYVCIMHKSKLRPNGFKLINKFIKSLYKFCKSEFTLYLFDNQSDEKYNIPSYHGIKYTYVDNQIIRGLAGPYNDGIKMAVKDGCNLIILVNDDIVMNETIVGFICEIENHEFKDISVYGPLTNGLHKNSHQLANKVGKGIREITNERGQFKNINGFLMAFTKEFYDLVKLPNGDFCDMKKMWSGGEEVMQNRARKRGGRMFIIKSCWINHKRLSGWSKIEKWKK